VTVGQLRLLNAVLLVCLIGGVAIWWTHRDTGTIHVRGRDYQAAGACGVDVSTLVRFSGDLWRPPRIGPLATPVVLYRLRDGRCVRAYGLEGGP
jgi:hypothetical protein